MILDREMRQRGLEVSLKNANASIIQNERGFTMEFKDDTYNKSNHGTIRDAESNLSKLLRRWKNRADVFTVLEGSNILDLASGSEYYRDFFLQGWPPFFARLCAVNGANVIAIDICNQTELDQQLFACVKLDLIDAVMNSTLGNNPFLEGKNFDIIYCSNFVGGNPVPYLERDLVGVGIKQEGFERKLFSQCSNLLSEGGVMTLDLRDNQNWQKYHKKIKGQIIDLP